MDEKEEEKKYIPSLAYEKELVKSLSDYLSLLKELEVNPPLLIFLTISGAKGFCGCSGGLEKYGSNERLYLQHAARTIAYKCYLVRNTCS